MLGLFAFVGLWVCELFVFADFLWLLGRWFGVDFGFYCRLSLVCFGVLVWCFVVLLFNVAPLIGGLVVNSVGILAPHFTLSYSLYVLI